VSVWDPITTRPIQNTSFTHYYGEQGNNALLHIWFGQYAVSDYDHKQIVVYNITTGEKEHTYGYDKEPSTIEWSPDMTLMAYQKDGTIEIKNTSTGKIVQRFPVPVYELKRSIPGFECVLMFCAIAILMVLRHKRKKH
jgi:WD40 repeat protein